MAVLQNMTANNCLEGDRRVAGASPPRRLKRDAIRSKQMIYQKLSKFEIAETQLNRALELYMTEEDLVSAITLAGAAEEIMGKLVIEKGGENALDEKVARLCEMFGIAFGERADPKNFIKLRNRARNEQKHFSGNDEIELDLEQEAVGMLRRAIKNYQKLAPRSRQKFWVFEKESVRRWRQRQNEQCTPADA